MLLTPRALNRATLARQHLLERRPAAPLQVIEGLFGLQAQLARPPFIGLWSRIAGFRREALHALLLERQVVRATAMRGTLHLMSTRDYLKFRTTLQPVLDRALQGVFRDRAKALDLDEALAFGRAFFGEQPRTFDALRAALLARDAGADERAIAYAIRMRLPLIQVPVASTWSFPAQADFAVAEAWLATAPDPASILPDLLLRYLAAFGPASVADAQTWSGLQGLKPVFEALRPQLVTFKGVDGKELFDLPEAPRPPEETPVPVRFLPDYDNLVLAHADRTRVIDDAHRPRIATRNLQVLATFLVDGRVAGTWKIETKRKKVTLTLSPFEDLSASTRDDLADEGLRLLNFVEPAIASPEIGFD